MSTASPTRLPNTAFIGLDYIVDITHPHGKLGHSVAQVSERQVIEKANRALACAQAKQWLSILVKVGFSQGYAEQPKHSPLFGRAHEIGALELGAAGTEFHPDLDAQLADLVIVKPRVSAFYSTQLEAALRACKIERVVVAGVSSSWAVQSTVRDAHDRDYEVIVLEDACAAANEEEHRASMALLGRIARISTTDELKNF